jgi:hypothetical protein
VTNMAKGEVVKLSGSDSYALDTGSTMTVRYSCKHKRGPGYGACGGCYARAVRALDQIQKDPTQALDVCREFTEQLKADKK